MRRLRFCMHRSRRTLHRALDGDKDDTDTWGAGRLGCYDVSDCGQRTRFHPRRRVAVQRLQPCVDLREIFSSLIAISSGRFGSHSVMGIPFRRYRLRSTSLCIDQSFRAKASRSDDGRARRACAGSSTTTTSWPRLRRSSRTCDILRSTNAVSPTRSAPEGITCFGMLLAFGHV